MGQCALKWTTINYYWPDTFIGAWGLANNHLMKVTFQISISNKIIANLVFELLSHTGKHNGKK